MYKKYTQEEFKKVYDEARQLFGTGFANLLESIYDRQKNIDNLTISEFRELTKDMNFVLETLESVKNKNIMGKIKNRKQSKDDIETLERILSDGEKHNVTIGFIDDDETMLFAFESDTITIKDKDMYKSLTTNAVIKNGKLKARIEHNRDTGFRLEIEQTIRQDNNGNRELVDECDEDCDDCINEIDGEC